MKSQNTISPEIAKQILPAVYAGLFASLCWIIGDLLIVGFSPNPENYPLFSETYASRVDVELATYMLTGSTNRLMWGALVAVFSIPFYLYSVWAVLKLIKGKFTKPIAVLLFCGISFWPLAHAGFFYVGEIYKAILNTPASAHEQLLKTADSFVQVLEIVWSIGIAMVGLAWLTFGVAVLMKKTLFKRNMVWLNPFIFTFVFVAIAQILPIPYGDYVGCASFNEAHFAFFAILLFIVLKRLKQKTS
ncbi:hypothetical protein KRX57_07940 [Weeksellaceae bacterium TAE3-ERU29]|nr:hypothetical protein [Weeksellaceae bacterium TAE3-ERU29]